MRVWWRTLPSGPLMPTSCASCGHQRGGWCRHPDGPADVQSFVQGDEGAPEDCPLEAVALTSNRFLRLDQKTLASNAYPPVSVQSGWLDLQTQDAIFWTEDMGLGLIQAGTYRRVHPLGQQTAAQAMSAWLKLRGGEEGP